MGNGEWRMPYLCGPCPLLNPSFSMLNYGMIGPHSGGTKGPSLMPQRRRGSTTRRQIIAGFFLLLGLLLLSNIGGVGAAEPETTKLGFGVPGPVVEVPSALSLVLIGVVFIAAGAAGLIPAPTL